MDILSLTAAQLNRAADLKEQITALEAELAQLAGGGGNGVPSPFSSKIRKKKLSDAGRLAIAAAQKLRWAKFQGTKPTVVKRRTMSAAARARIAAAARARWARAKAAGKKSL